MESKVGFLKEKTFPTKASMKPDFKIPETKAVSNHFKVLIESGSTNFYEWHFSFFHKTDLQKYIKEPNSVPTDAIPTDSRHLISEVLKANRKEMFEKLGKNFSTGVTLFSIKKPQFSTAIFDAHPKFVLLVQKKNDVSTVDSLTSDNSSRFQLLRFLNSSVKNIFSKLDFIELGRNKKYYNPKFMERVNSGDHKFMILKGYKTAFEVYEGGLKLMIDYSTRIIREYSLWEEIQFYKQANRSDEDIIEDCIKTKSVMTIYGSQRIFRIDEVLQKGRITDPFPDATFKNYADYFLKKYKIQLRFKDQFLLVHHKKIVDRDAKGNEVSRRIEKIVLLPELVRATGLTDEMRSDFKIMKDIGQHTILDPRARMDNITKIISEHQQVYH